MAHIKGGIVIQYNQTKLAHCLKIVNWVLAQPNLTSQEPSCEWYTKDSKVYLGVVTQDLFLELCVGESSEVFHIAVPPKPLQQLIAKMDNTIEVTFDETAVVLEDSVQKVKLTQIPTQDLPVYQELTESYQIPAVRPIIKHLHDVATEQVDVSDLDLAFTTAHAFIGNYAYAKRIPCVTDIPFTLPNVLTKLILATLHEQRSDDITYRFVRGYAEMLELSLGEHKLYTSLYSKVVPAVDALFDAIRPTYIVDVPLNQLQDILVRLKALSTDSSVELTFNEEHQLTCTVSNAFQTSDFNCNYIGTAFDLRVDVDINALYHLLKNAVAADTLHLQFDTEQEVLCIVNEDNEMLVSLLIA